MPNLNHQVLLPCSGPSLSSKSEGELTSVSWLEDSYKLVELGFDRDMQLTRFNLLFCIVHSHSATVQGFYFSFISI